MNGYAPALLAAALSFGLCPLVRLGLDRAMVRDEPTWRSSHTRPVPRGGGIAVVAAVTVALAAAAGAGRVLAGVLVVGLGLGAVGLVDDLRRGAPAPVRLVATVVLAAGGLAVLRPAPAGWSGAVVLMAVFWIVAYVNAFNFMDGINGISAAQALVGGGTLAVAARAVGAGEVAVAAAVVAGAALGFAPFNFPSARLFLGDVGSYAIGGMLALLVVAAVAAGVPVEAATFPFVLYAADTGTTLARRMARGERWWDAHREHTYQRLVDAGWSHAAATGLVALVSAATAGLGLVSLTSSATGRVSAALSAAALVAGYLALPAVLLNRRAPDRAPAPEAAPL